MEKNEVLGEILYVGLVFEKGRCKNSGIWKMSYVKSLKKHIRLLKVITECMKKPFREMEDNICLHKVCSEILNDTTLRKHYPFWNVENIMCSERSLITNCQNENIHMEIVCFLDRLLEDIILELNKGIRKNKEKINRIIFSAHNLPRVYLNEEATSLCLLKQEGISPQEAFAYSKLSMDDSMLLDYNFFLDIENRIV